MTAALLALLALQDWPTWRHDPERSAASPAELPVDLGLRWSREFPAPAVAWPDQARAQFDATIEPVVADGRLFLSSTLHDGVSAYDAKTGALLWRFFADGPVRFPPTVADGRVYAVSDDGHLHCLDAQSGGVLWSHRGAPSDRRGLANGRVASLWPARGAPAVHEGTVYYGAGIWPFMGIFLYALDARTGREVWVNDGDGSLYHLQPHTTEAFAGVAPQGSFVVKDDFLLVPGGRSIPAVYDRRTGRLLHYRLAENSRRGGHDVTAFGRVYTCGPAFFDLAAGDYVGEFGSPFLVGPDGVTYAGKASGLYRSPFPVLSPGQFKDRKGKVYTRLRMEPVKKESVDVDADVRVLIRAGGTIYAGAKGAIYRIDAKTNAVKPPLAVEGTPTSLVAAAGRLFVATAEHRLFCFGPGDGAPVKVVDPSVPLENGGAGLDHPVLAAGIGDGWVVRFGGVAPRAVPAEAVRLRRPLLVVYRDAKDARAAREAIAAVPSVQGAAVLQGEPATIALPPYFARGIVVDGPLDREGARRLFESLHPYGGRLVVRDSGGPDLRAWTEGLPSVAPRAETRPGWRILVRDGGLPGAGNWTHEHADGANTRVGRDEVVKAPLGLLWFGGSTHTGILPRHGHGPQPQVLDGRLFIEGVDFLRAMDIYTGRVLWETPLPNLGALFNNTAHQPGANASGTNYVSMRDGLYVAYGRKGLRLDLATGQPSAEFLLPPAEDGGEPPVWGYINAVDDVLVAGADPLGADRPLPKYDPTVGDDNPFSSAEALLAKLKSTKIPSDTFSSSKRLVVLDRKTGAPLWSASAVHGWRHNAICAGDGRLYAVDRLSGIQEEKLKRADQPLGAPARLVAFDLKTGKEIWSTTDDVFGTWLSYSEEHDVLVEAGRVARDTMSDEAKGMRARRGADGREIWKDEKRLGPAMILGRTLHMVGRACDLLTGKPVLRTHPVTEQDVEWTWTRTYGCNTPMLSTHLLTFRSGAAGYFDLANDGGTGNFGGFRSSCTNNLVVAGGILTAPDYTRTCTCGYQNQTSIALVPMPEAEMWTFYGSTDLKGAVRRVGVNLGAPGDRVDGKTLWLEHPSVGGKSPAAPVKLAGTPEYFRRHASRVKGPLPWVAASGAKNVSSLTVALDKSGKERAYRVRLVFVDPGGTAPFDVSIQGKKVIEKLAFEAPWTSVVRDVEGIRAGKELKIDFTPPGVLSGVEVVCEESLAPEDKLAVQIADPGEDNEVLYFPRAEAADEASERDDVRAEPFFWAAGALSVLVVILLAVRLRGGRA